MCSTVAWTMSKHHTHQHQQQQRDQQQGRLTQAIVETNRKTEICRNWQNGLCTYGGRCAFAHGSKELKYRTLREMQTAGRIPDAAKYRCYPCMTWVATGSCPYSSRCVFIHDPRVKGPLEAWLYAGHQTKSSAAAYPSSDSSFFFPDMPRDPDSFELPRDPSLYELDPGMITDEDRANRAVYHLWYSLVDTLTGDKQCTSAATITPTTRSAAVGSTVHARKVTVRTNGGTSRLINDSRHSRSGSSSSSIDSVYSCFSGYSGESSPVRIDTRNNRDDVGSDLSAAFTACRASERSPCGDRHIQPQERPLSGQAGRSLHGDDARLPVFLSLCRGLPLSPTNRSRSARHSEAFPIGKPDHASFVERGHHAACQIDMARKTGEVDATKLPLGATPCNVDGSDLFAIDFQRGAAVSTSHIGHRTRGSPATCTADPYNYKDEHFDPGCGAIRPAPGPISRSADRDQFTVHEPIFARATTGASSGGGNSEYGGREIQHQGLASPYPGISRMDAGMSVPMSRANHVFGAVVLPAQRV